MAESDGAPAPRYHRRVLALGGVVLLAVYVIGAPIYNNRVEADLEQRVPDELADAGFTGVVAAFDGQDGSLTCEEPLSDPEAAVDAAYEVWGVRQIDLDQGCRVRSAATGSDTADAEDAGSGTVASTAATGATADDGSGTAAAGDSTPSTPPDGSVVDFDTVSDIIGGSPELSLLAALLGSTGVDPITGADGEVTVFAPSDDAFDLLPADALADLRGDPELLTTVLDRHVILERLHAEDLETGVLTTRAGDELEVERTGDSITVDGATVTAPDIAAADGVVHVIDQLLLPAELAVSTEEVAEPLTASATFSDGSVVLEGVVATEVERASVVDAAASALGEQAVDDRLTVDPDAGLDGEAVTGLVALVEVLTSELVTGTASFDGTGFAISGRYATEEQRDAVLAVAEEVDASTDLEVRPAADESDAVDLEAELNAYAAANPILFEPGSPDLSGSAGAVLDTIARQLGQFDGVSVTVEGHTDSDGSDDANLLLSQLRADAVVAALVERGLPATIFTAEGFGSQQPIVVDGAEDKAASRRVEFRVESTS